MFAHYEHFNSEEERIVLTDCAELLKALGHPVRLSIVKNLCSNGACNVTNMQNSLMMPQSTVSQHLSKLKALGIVEGKRHGTEIVYSVIHPGAKQIVNTLQKLKQQKI